MASSIAQLSDSVSKALRFMQFWKLDIDAEKSWSWSTKPLSKGDAEMLSNLIAQPSVDDPNYHHAFQQTKPLKIVKSQKDLGATMRYRRVLSVTNTRERFEKSIQRIRRLLSVPCSLEQVWRAINVGAISCALYGIESLPLGFQHFQKIRGAMADTVCETFKNRSEWLATACTNFHVNDPEVKTIKKCIRTCRKFLASHPDLIQISFDTLATIPPDTKRVFGPLGCLKRWLTRLGWTIRENGCIVTSQNIVLSLLFTCPDEIAHHVDLAWSDIVSNQVSHRKGMNHLPALNFAATSKHLKKFNDVDQKIISKYLAGAFAHGDKNFHRGTSDGMCQFCNNPDNLAHRIYSCPFFQDIRADHSNTLQWMNENCPHWNATPIVPCHPDEIRWGQIKNIAPSPLTLNLDPHNGMSRRFFTDGSCRSSTTPEGAFASWSAVEDFSQSDNERMRFAETFRNSSIKPSCFQLSSRKQVRGRQTNDRAELSAVIFAVSQSFLVEIFTDSMYAISILARVLDGISLGQCINDRRKFRSLTSDNMDS